MGFAYAIFFIVPKLIAHYLPGLIYLPFLVWFVVDGFRNEVPYS